MPNLEPEAAAATGRRVVALARQVDALLLEQESVPHLRYHALTHSLARAIAAHLLESCPSVNAPALAMEQILPFLLELTQLELRNLMDQRTPF